MSRTEPVEPVMPNVTNQNLYTVNPPDINLNDRQEQDEEARRKYPQEEKKKGFRHYARRILVGKEVDEELYEQQYHHQMNWFKNEVRRHFAEYIGTFFLIFFICGIQVNQGFFPDGGVANVDKGIVTGFVLIGLIFAFGRVSGAHFNPCVTLAFLLRGSFKFLRFVTYIVAQFAGAITAAAILYGLFGNVDHLGTTVPGAGIGERNAFGTEILLTLLLVTVILTTAESANIVGATAGLAVGLTFGAIQAWAWNFTGASVNPWRTIAPTMISNFGWNTYWIYIVGPLVGTVLAVLLQRLMVTGIPRKDTKCTCKGTGSICLNK